MAYSARYISIKFVYFTKYMYLCSRKTRDDLTYEERQIYDAINSSSVTIKITSEKTKMMGDKHVFYASIKGKAGYYECLTGGADLGSVFNPSTKKAESFSFIDMDMLDHKGYNQGVAHEVSEGLHAGLIAIRDKKDVEMAEQNVPNSRMMEAHNKAIPERVTEGALYQFGIEYGKMGKIK